MSESWKIFGGIGGKLMNRTILIAGLWILWLYSARGNVQLGSYNSIEECKSAKEADHTGIMFWKTYCVESKQ